MSNRDVPRTIVPLSEARASELPSMGVKAARLAELCAAGISVPPAFVITTRVLREHVARLGVPEPELPRAVLEAPLDPEVVAGVSAALAALGPGPLVVRPSVAPAGGDARSFAGQFDGTLEVDGLEGVLAAVRRCWASSWSRRVAAYTRAGAASPRFELAVIVQRRVAARVAGVLFTADPLGEDPDALVIEAARGAPGAVASGRVAADSYAVTRRDLGLRSRTVHEPPALSDDEALAVARVGLRIRDSAGADQDVEWALEGSRVHVLQARTLRDPPRRVAAPAGDLETSSSNGLIWSRIGVGEMFEGVLTPLGASLARHYQKHVHARCVAALGVREPGDPRHYYRFHRGRMYANVSYFAYLLSQTPPGRDLGAFTRSFAGPGLDLSGYTNPYGKYPEGSGLAKAEAFWLLAKGKDVATLGRTAERLEARSREEDARLGALRLEARTSLQMADELQRQLDVFQELYPPYLACFFDAFIVLGVLQAMSRTWGATGLAERASQRMDVRRAQMVELAARSGADLEAFLSRHGTACVQEIELTRPRWIDDPASALAALETMRRAGPLAPVPTVSLSRVPLFRRATLEMADGLHARTAELRLRMRRPVTGAIWRVRRVVLELGRRLVSQGGLESIDELAWVELPELLRHAKGGAPPAALFPRAKLEERRRAHEVDLAAPEPPASWVGEDPPRDSRSRKAASAEPLLHGGEPIRGVGSSPGTVVGRARVVLDLASQLADFEAGEILVAPHVDASFTPLFGLASAIVTDLGSMVSHASILSREYNLPSVVDTKIATSRVATGDMIAVDAGTGTVRVLS